MNELQSRLLDMLKWFHMFCEKNGLQYYVLGGTMLGAVRHQGFIPWDDDIDVGLPRDDYEKLKQLMNDTTFENRLILEEPFKNKDFIYPYCKLYDTSTTLIENAKRKVKRGIYIDVFPLDGIGNTEMESKRNYKKIKKLKTLVTLKVVGFRHGRKFYKNVGVALFRLVPLNPGRLLKELVNECSKYPYNKYAYCGNLVGNWGGEIVPRSVMGTPALYKFETIEVYGAEKADEYLTSLYGDWRKLPPIEKQVTQHDYVELDLRRSYLGV